MKRYYCDICDQPIAGKLYHAVVREETYGSKTPDSVFVTAHLCHTCAEHIAAQLEGKGGQT